MSVSRICVVLAGIAIVVGVAASSPLADDGRSISMVNTVTAAETAGQGWFGE